ncbi:hypothetical protein BaRGS_00001430, partial [Batillaria attramentaria]
LRSAARQSAVHAYVASCTRAFLSPSSVTSPLGERLAVWRPVPNIALDEKCSSLTKVTKDARSYVKILWQWNCVCGTLHVRYESPRLRNRIFAVDAEDIVQVMRDRHKKWESSVVTERYALRCCRLRHRFHYV